MRFSAYLRHRRRAILAFFLCALLFALSIYLYNLPVAAVLYPTALCLLLLTVFAVLDYNRLFRAHRELEEIKRLPPELIELLPQSDCVLCGDYRELIGLICAERKQSLLDYEESYRARLDYYTAWAHQIKIPIASMRLRLQSMDSLEARRLLTELGRIERYSDMVMTFLRLDSDTSDFVFREQSLDAIIKPVIRKFAGDFILKKLRLEYEPTDFRVLTDEKWLSFVIEQLLSNALKYTSEGSVSIYLEGNVLCIRDTGMGIAPDELPRIFEKGYTGSIGRREKAASGIGLYLCKRVCRKLCHGISASSKLGEGSVFRLELGKRTLPLE